MSVQARAIIIATGVQYRKPELPNLARFEGVGVYYSATQIEASFCRGEDVIVVGGGNSAGQAAVFLSGQVRHVHMLVQRPAARGEHVALPDPADRGDAERSRCGRGPSIDALEGDAQSRAGHLARRGRSTRRPSTSATSS